MRSKPLKRRPLARHPKHLDRSSCTPRKVFLSRGPAHHGSSVNAPSIDPDFYRSPRQRSIDEPVRCLYPVHSTTIPQAMITSVRMRPPRISIIMPCFNSEGYISEAIDSVISQTLGDWELIVIDDASTDGTKEIVLDYVRQDSRIQFHLLPSNQGPAFVRNRGLDEAKGDYVAFIDSDDTWDRVKAERQVSVMDALKADICYTSYRRRTDRDDAGKTVEIPATVTYRTMLRRCYIACSTAMVRRSTCGTVRMPPIQRRQDHGYWLALLRDGSRKAVGIPEPLASYRLRSDSLSANKLRAARSTWRLLRDVEAFSLVNALWFFFGYAFDAVLLRVLLKLRRD